MNTTHIDRLVDERFGLIKRLVRHQHPPELPAALVSFSADVADTRRFGAFQADRVALGAAFGNEDHARMAAIGEAAERYCGNAVPRNLCRASHRDLAAAGMSALDPRALVLYSATQYAERGFPFIPFTEDTAVPWVAGHDMATGAEILLPASIVYVNFYSQLYADQPPTNFVMYSGIACGATRADAERAALEELIERDATMIWWMSGSPAPGIDLATAPRIQAALATRTEHEIAYHLVHIPTPFDVPVIGALIEDRALRVMALGVACRPEPQAAALKALVEAMHLRIFAQGLLDPHGHVWQGVRAGVLDVRSFKPFRADRRYCDAYRLDFHDVIDLGSQAQIYLDPRMHPYLTRITAPDTTCSINGIPAVSSIDLRATYLERLRARGFSAYSVDLTTDDVRAVGLHVVRVVVPGLYPNAPAAFPFLGGKRLRHEPYELGWLPAPLREDQIVRIPLPHT